MFSKTVLSTIVVLAVCLCWACTAGAQATDPSLVGWWKFDEGSGSTAIDSSGNGNNGTIVNAQWDTGVYGDGLDFGGDAYVEISANAWSTIDTQMTISFWAYGDPDALPAQTWVFAAMVDRNANDTRVASAHLPWSNDQIYFDTAWTAESTYDRINKTATPEEYEGSWQHWTFTKNADTGDQQIYLNGVLWHSGTGMTKAMTGVTAFTIGCRCNYTLFYSGQIDDFRLYNRALTQTEIEALAVYPKSSEPSPADGERILDNQTILAWAAGHGAVSHDVYFGDSYDNVAAGTGGTHLGEQANALLLVGYGSGPVPDRLEFGKTYYWRVDEIEADGTKHPGDTWSFSTPSQQAETPQPTDGARFIKPAVELSWTPGFKAILHTVYFGDDYDTVLNATGNSGTPMTTFDPPGDLELGKTYYWRVDETDETMSEKKGEVWSFSTLPVIPITDPNLVAWWRLDEGEGNVVVDWSGYGHHGTIQGDAAWTAGYDGGAIDFDGADDYVNMDGYKGITVVDGVQPAFTQMAWINTGANGEIMTWGNNAGRQRLTFRVDTYIRSEHGSGNIRGTLGPDLRDSQWHHVVAVIQQDGYIDDRGVTLYVDGVNVTPDVADDPDTFNLQPTADVSLGRRATNNDRWFTGMIDDARIYDRVLTQEEIQLIMLRPNPYRAWEPTPTSGSVPEIEDVTALSWSPGDDATQHDVYFGTDPNAVRDADTSSPEYKTSQAGTTYSLAGEGLAFGSGTFYWRIDEVKADATVTTGRVWTFTVPDYIVIDEFEDYNNTEPFRVFDKWIDGTIQPALGGSQVGYWLEQADLDAGESFLENGNVGSGQWSMPYVYANSSEAILPLEGLKRDWTRHGVTTLRLEYDGHDPVLSSFTEDPFGTYTMVSAGLNIFGEEDSFNFAWKRVNGPCTITARVDYVEPVAGGARAGVMIRDNLDPNSVNAVMKIRSDGGIRFNRRTEVPGTTGGDSQGGFSIPIWVRLERDLGGRITAYEANDVGGSWDTWTQVNYVDIPMSGTVYVGLAFCANAGGRRGTATLSNVTIDGDVIDNTFTYQDIGIQSNVAAPMYVSLKDTAGQTAKVSSPDPDAANLTAWTQWGEYGQGIALTQFLTENPSLNMASIETMSIGFEGGGSGLMFFDTIRLYGPRCVPELAKPSMDLNSDCKVSISDLEMVTAQWLADGLLITPVAPDSANLAGHWKLDDGSGTTAADDSGNGNNGTIIGAQWATGKVGGALEFDGTGGYVDCGNNPALQITGDVTISAWVKLARSNAGGYYGIAGKLARDGDLNYHGFSLVRYSSNEFRFWVGDGTADLQDTSSDVTYTDTQWHHVAGVVEAGVNYLYVDGLPQIQTSNKTISDSGEFAHIGRQYSHLSDRYFNGLIDDVRIYGRALTDQEIGGLAGKTEAYSKPFDLDVDGTVNFTDIAILAQTWGDEVLWP